MAESRTLEQLAKAVVEAAADGAHFGVTPSEFDSIKRYPDEWKAALAVVVPAHLRSRHVEVVVLGG